MPGIGWKCQCGEIIEERTNFKWEFKCSCDGEKCVNCGKAYISACSCGGNRYTPHSQECGQKDWQAKEAKLKGIVDKHLAICGQAHKCSKCRKPFDYKETYTEVSNDPKAGDYHKSCWEEIKNQQRESQHKCSNCGNTTSNGLGSLCDSCYPKEQQRERERERAESAISI